MKDITESEIAILWATSRKFSALKYFHCSNRELASLNPAWKIPFTSTKMWMQSRISPCGVTLAGLRQRSCGAQMCPVVWVRERPEAAPRREADSQCHPTGCNGFSPRNFAPYVHWLKPNSKEMTIYPSAYTRAPECEEIIASSTVEKPELEWNAAIRQCMAEHRTVAASGQGLNKLEYTIWAVWELPGCLWKAVVCSVKSHGFWTIRVVCNTTKLSDLEHFPFLSLS